MLHEDKGVNKRAWPLALCLFLSLLLHALAAWGLAVALAGRKPPGKPAPSPGIRLVRVSYPEKQKAEKLPFAKTDPDRPEQTPDRPDFEGKRDTRASADEKSIPHRSSDAPVPTQQGEQREDLNTLDRERQDGPLGQEGNRQASSSPATTAPAQPNTSPAPDNKDNGERHDSPQGATEQLPAFLQQEPSDIKLPAIITNKGKGQAVSSPKRRLPYDPSLADHAQPGFRTYERRTRSTGKFVLGRHASLNVAATPRGKYEELIYRRIAYFWYIACDDHRGDIIPGSITIALRINKNGSITNMELISRRGAGIIQQSFTFAAIRKASLPPMPETVRQSLVGDLMELIFTFNFD